MEKRLLSLISMLMLLCGIAAAQAPSTVRGSVTSADDGEAIVGASVMVVGTNIGANTDIDGRFVITNVPSSAKYVTVAYVGMATQEVKIAPNMEIKMKPTLELGEVVVTAMGIKRDKKALGYASQDLKADELITDGTTSMASAIQGKLTGVDIRQSSGAPGASAQIVIRGARSFDGNNQPLYVIDGMPVTTTPDVSTGYSTTGANIADRSIDINPDDIESINVLKGQAASALYGIRASNGVIVITTKRGSASSLKPQVTVSTNIAAQRVSRKFERQTEYAQGNGYLGYSPTSSMTWGPKISEIPNDPVYGGNTQNDYTASGLHQGQYYSPQRAQAGLDPWTTPQIYDNVGDFFGSGLTENTSLNITHSVGGVNYSVSVSNSYQDGIIPSTMMNRWNARGLVDWRLSKEWSTGFSGIYSSSKIKSAPGANSGIMNVVYSAPAEYDLKGIPSHVPGDPTQQILFRSLSFTNPYWWAEHNSYNQHTNRFFGNAYIEFAPNINWGDNMSLKFREQAGIDMWTSDYSDINEVGTTTSLKNGDIENYGSEHNVFNNLFTINFDAQFGDDWNLNVLLGNEINHENVRTWDYYGSNFNFPGFPTIGNTASISGGESKDQERTVGFFGSAMASWKNQIYLTVTGRNDYVSSMPRNNRSFFYPSVSLGWEFTQLPAFHSQKVISYGKLRASFAQVGQAGRWFQNYYWTPSYGGGFYDYTPVSYPLPSGVSSYVPYYVVYDKDLKPQNTSNFEVGADINLWNNRIKMEYTYSYQNITDQIFTVPTDGSIGYQYVMTNAGKMRTNSHEFSINAAILQARDYDLNLGVNFTKVENKVVELAPGVESIMLGGFVEPQIRAQAGCTYPNIYGLKFQRDDQGRLLTFEGLPMPTGDSYDLGNCSPDFVMGFNLSGRYKRVSLSSTWSWQQGGHMYHGTNMTMNYFGATKESLPFHEGTMVVEGIDAVTGQPNTIEVAKEDYYRAYYDVTESGVYDTSFFKLRDLTVTYQLPRIWKLDISVYGFARNVLVWAKLPNFDPESSQGNGNMGGYFERFSVPATSSYGGGLTVKF